MRALHLPPHLAGKVFTQVSKALAWRAIAAFHGALAARAISAQAAALAAVKACTAGPGALRQDGNCRATLSAEVSE